MTPTPLSQPVKKVLYIDDAISRLEEAETSILSLQQTIPCDMEWAPDSLSAIWSIQKNIFDVCILDYNDNNEADFELLNHLKDTGSSTPVILYTSTSLPAIEKKVKSAGAADVIDKSSVDKYILEKSIRYAISAAGVNLEDLKSIVNEDSGGEQQGMGTETGEIAQNLNNLLSIIQGSSRVLEAQMDKDDPLLKHPLQIAKAAQNAEQLTQRLMAQSRRQLLNPEHLDFNAVVYEMEPMLKSIMNPGTELILKLQPGIHQVKVDRGQMGQMIYNLVLNAAEAIKGKGEIILQTMNEVKKVPMSGDDDVLIPQKFVSLSVSDTGTGLTDEEKEQIFYPDYTTKTASRVKGLGLATVYWIMKHMGGFIQVESEKGRGAEFKLTFPLEKIESGANSPPTVELESSKPPKTILLVDDESSIRLLIKETLAAEGFNMLEAENAEDALRLFDQKENNIDLLLTDVVLPLYSGPELALTVSKSSPETRILFMSAHTNERIIRNQFRIEPNGFLQKPFSLDELVKTVKKIMNTKKPGDYLDATRSF